MSLTYEKHIYYNMFYSKKIVYKKTKQQNKSLTNNMIRIIIRIEKKEGIYMKENYTYPVLIEELEDNVILTFPSFDYLVTETGPDKDFIKAAQEVIALQIIDAEDDGKEVPSYYNGDIVINEGQKLIYVNVWMPYHRTLTKTVYVRKNITIPAWIDELAKASGINFSETLTEALKHKLLKEDL